MVINKQTFYKVLFITLLCVPVLVAKPEVNIAISIMLLAFLLLDIRYKYSAFLVTVITPLLLLVGLAFLVSLFYSYDKYDIIKDVLFLLKPILFIVIGYYLTGKIIDKNFIYKAIIYIGIFFALKHIYHVAYFLLNYQINITRIRGLYGKANYIELFAMVLLFGKNIQQSLSLKIKHLSVLKIILTVSFIFYFSRTMMVGIVILLLAINGYTKLTKKGIVYIFIFFLSIVTMYAVLFSIDLDRNGTSLEKFFYKVKIAPSEIFTSKIDVSNHANLWDHWRGYEASRAFMQLDETKNDIGFVVGKGTGALVDLGFVAPLNRDGIQYIPILHNGFVYILFKSGIIGVLLFLLFLAILYQQGYKKNTTQAGIYINNLISGIAIYYIFTTLIITGPYNHGDVVTLILGALLYHKYQEKKQKKLETCYE